jgi:hypothetical protein
MKIQKLDRRHNGHKVFKYFVGFSFYTTEKFIEVRNWCWQTWGPSCELEHANKLEICPKWAWLSDQYNMRIYLQTDAEYSWFLIKWK